MGTDANRTFHSTLEGLLKIKSTAGVHIFQNLIFDDGEGGGIKIEH